MVKKLCNHVGCGRFATAHGYCDLHQSDYKPKTIPDKWSTSPYQSLYHTKQWQDLSKKILLERPVCQMCNCRQSQEVHHVTHEDFFNEDTLVALCHDCHFQITQEEIQSRKADREAELEMKKRYGI